MDFLRLPKRTTGSRSYGLTSIVDFGTPVGELKHILGDYHQFIDIAKIGIGSAYIAPNLKEKIKLYQEYGIRPYFGGTLFEKCYLQNKLSEYLSWLAELGIEWVEVSNGTFDIPLEERLEIVSEFKRDFWVIAEVGSKDSECDMPVTEWKQEIDYFLNAGCQYVITEGRDSGTAGIYDQNGRIKSNLVKNLLEELDDKKIIFEAPTHKHQMYFINEIGPNVNLGNVKLADVLILEAQRQGLRSETFYLEEQEWKLPL
ncbi:MAG TPA: phosphosulfolactate synthase [Bacillus sp. (in: Bacteria)]|uniref:Phosphosulfolactate synthase n=1 Tax=Anoxybacillus andreesenii TaxID=1325932 RepID=A0ABT9V3K8_9BACL|nr:phosphosulfolactate synthase [Robertmurraya andreesenii]MDQ0155445.1 phosphosulfolactate synthase [Robertmurraya andreesenii]HCX48207.1 phosphosulfolactate synthase [Bacillus sp. (in: firmicutes)]